MSWRTSPLEELCKIEIGKTPARATASYWDDKKATCNVWLSIADLGKAENKVISDSKEYLSDKGAALCKRVPRGSLLLSFKLTLGRVAFAGVDLFTNEAIAALTIRRPEVISKEYLFYFFQFFDWDAACEGDVKLKGKTLNKEKLRAIKIRYPTLPEQRRIVSILDEAFAGLEAMHVNAEKNLQNARELFDNYLDAIFSDCDGQCAEYALGELASFRNGINYTKASRGELIRVVGVADFKNNFWAPLGKLQTATVSGSLSDTDLLQEGDIIFVRSNGNVELIGRTLLVGPVPERITHSGFTIRARLYSAKARPQFVCWFLKSGKVRRAMVAGGIGTNIKSLNQASLSSLTIQLPSMSQQDLIVARIDEIRSASDKLTSVYAEKLSAIDELKQSILQKAFSGELTSSEAIAA